MPDSASNKLSLVKEIITEGKMEDALELIKDIELMENLTQEEILRTLHYKADLYWALGQFENARKLAEDLYQKGQEKKMPFFSLDGLFVKGRIIISLGRLEEYYKIIEQQDTMFHSIPREDSFEFQEREARLIFAKGFGNMLKGNFDLSLDYYDKSLALFEKIDPHSSFIPQLLTQRALAYQAKGELNLSIEDSERALSLFPEGEYYLGWKGNINHTMGNIYKEKGELNKALEHHVSGLDIYNKFNNTVVGWLKSMSYLNIIELLLVKKDTNQARNYQEQFKRFEENYENRAVNLLYQLACALILKSSSRMRDRAEAENRLKNIIEEKPRIDITNIALINLCDWYFEEFRISNEMEILDDIQPLIDRLQGYARQSNSFSDLANVKLLQAKLALLQINMIGARKLLTEAQQIADEHDLQLLAGEISREHDRLLEELKLWESFKKTQASVPERLKLASIDGVMERLQGRRAIEVPESSVEEPILLLIMDKSGVAYFNHSFIGDWDFDDLFSSFMSAFNAFTGEIFSKSIDRVKVGENTILINPIEPFLACYVIKGQSYPAQQKLTRFSDAIKASPEIWDALNKAVKTSETLELDNPPSLGSTVNEIFI